MCTQWVPCASVFTFYALHSFLFQRVVDGGFSDNIPQSKDINDIITLSPFSGDFDICLHGIGSLCVSLILRRRTRTISVRIIYNFTSFSREECLPLVVVFAAKVAPSPWSPFNTFPHISICVECTQLDESECSVFGCWCTEGLWGVEGGH